ncbi:MAG: DNA methylase [Clostridia bacterium]|nr:DNA methylase [Clostridia bacterium]
MDRTYVAIDLKSFYASVELADRKYDPLTTHLVVADDSRTDKTICLAVSPSLKACGIPGRPRLFEVIRQVKELNEERFRKACALGLLPKNPGTGQYHFKSFSFDAEALAADPSLGLSYIIAPPRMKLYEKISSRIVGIYLKYVSSEDIHVYSIDECFMDITGYLETYGLSPRELTGTMIRNVLHDTGITATAGIGTNLYLAKIAMDIVAKHVPADKDGVRIAELNEAQYREQLWCHTPLTDFWRVGPGTTRRLALLGCHTMGDIARLSLTGESRLFAALGIGAELLIDHAWGWEPTELSAIHSCQPETKSLSSGQVLMEPYDWGKAKLIVREMTDQLVLDLVRKGYVTRQVVLTVGYDKSSIVPLRDSGFAVAKTGRPYAGHVRLDLYGRSIPAYAHGTGNLDQWTNSVRRIMDVMMELYDRIVDPDLTVRRISVDACNLIPEDEIPAGDPVQLDFFTDWTALEKRRAKETRADEKERQLQKARLAVRGKFGNNALLKGTSLQKGATARQRNEQIGGHRAGIT